MNNSFYSLFEHNIQDIYNSEVQITAALPKMVNAAKNPDLREALSNHLEETRVHVQRIQQVCEQLGIPTGNVKCQATAGLIREAQEQLEEFGSSSAGDAAIVGCAQKVEHYEIANYGTLIEWAKQLDFKDVRNILKETLEEESKANEKLTKIATHDVNEAALQGATLANSGARLI